MLLLYGGSFPPEVPWVEPQLDGPPIVEDRPCVTETAHMLEAAPGCPAPGGFGDCPEPGELNHKGQVTVSTSNIPAA